MKATGIVRRIDPLGRIVLPIELRRTFKVNQDDALEIFVDGSNIILTKYEPACIFCGEVREIKAFDGRNICIECIKEIKDINVWDKYIQLKLKGSEGTLFSIIFCTNNL